MRYGCRLDTTPITTDSNYLKKENGFHFQIPRYTRVYTQKREKVEKSGGDSGIAGGIIFFNDGNLRLTPKAGVWIFLKDLFMIQKNSS